jgi:thiosulfate/3-mercaptopyruvate sulfurtransferase
VTTTVFITPIELAEQIAAGLPLRILEARRDDTISVDEHLPDAVPVSLTKDLARADAPATAGRRPLPRIDTLQVAAQGWGLNSDTAVVVYDHDGDFVAARAWWVLRWAGLRDVTILDGGLTSWRSAGYQLGDLAEDVAPGDVVLTPGHLEEIDGDAAVQLATGGRLIDARAADAFTDGHIPGARNVSSHETLSATRTLRDEAEFRRLYGLDEADTEVPGLYCGGGVAGAHAVAVLAHLGVAAPLYVGSFSAWSADPLRPIAIGSAAQT